MAKCISGRGYLFFFFFFLLLNAIAAAVMFTVISFPDDCKHQKWRVMYCVKGRWVTLIGGGDVCVLAQLASPPPPPLPFTPSFLPSPSPLALYGHPPPLPPLLLLSPLAPPSSLSLSPVSQTHIHLLLNTHSMHAHILQHTTGLFFLALSALPCNLISAAWCILHDATLN